MKIDTVTVIGATGTMGANVAGIFASFGDARVYCVGRDYDKVKKTIPRIVKSVKADSIARNLIPADISALEKCVSESDLVFESSAEDIRVKTGIARRIGSVLPSSAVSCTGTSGLSVTAIAESYPDAVRGHFFGVHMFNPPYSMSLCELVSTSYSDAVMKADLIRYLKSKLYRTVVEVKDSPAFLGNRIGFHFINDALLHAEKYRDNGGIDYIDAILGPFTGRSMAPLMTSDFVGLDVHKAILDNIHENTRDYARDIFVSPKFLLKLIEEKKLGRKSGEGLYKTVQYDDGVIRQTVFDISSGLYRDIIPYAFPFADQMKKYISEGDYLHAFDHLVNNKSLEATICRYFLLNYIVYSLYAAKEVGYSIDSADDVMATGFNWCPPLALYHAFSAVTDVPALIRHDLRDVCGKVNVDTLLADVRPSKYDYRPYFKSGR